MDCVTTPLSRVDKFDGFAGGGFYRHVSEKSGQSGPDPYHSPKTETGLAPKPSFNQSSRMTDETSHSLRSQPWPNIVARFRNAQVDELSVPFSAAHSGVTGLAKMVAEGPLSSVYFGWTSMFDLCVQQTDADPYSAPYLKVSPLPTGLVEFRYIDTTIQARQWHREVPPDAVNAQFVTFLEQLNWTA